MRWRAGCRQGISTNPLGFVSFATIGFPHAEPVTSATPSNEPRGSVEIVISQRKVRSRFESVARFGAVEDLRPPSSYELKLPEEIGFERRSERLTQVNMEGNWLVSVRGATIQPGGILTKGKRLHLASFRTGNIRENTRHLKVKSKAGRSYFVVGKRVERLTKVQRLKEAFFFDSEYPDEFGHTFLETFSRIWPLIDYPELRDVPLVTSASRTELIRALLELMGLGEVKIIQISSPVTVSRLWVSSQSYQLGKGFTPEAQNIYARVRRHLSIKDSGRKLFLSREGLQTRTGRKLRNEREVEGLFSDFGFETVRPHELPFPEQVSLYSACSEMAGPTGSAMFNRIFLRKPSKEILLGPSNYILPDHAHLRMMVGGDVKFVVNGQPLEPDRSPQSGSWSLSLDVLRDALQNA